MFAFAAQTRKSPRFSPSIAACFFISSVLARSNTRIAKAPAPTSGDGCGTLYSKFGDDQCLHISFDGEASPPESFERKFGKNLSFRLSASAAGGWTLEIVPDTPAAPENAEYSWVVNPPYHFSNIRYLDTSYGITAKQAVSNSPREFNFVTNDEQYKRAADLVEHAAMSHPKSEHKTEEEFAKESQGAWEALLALPVSKGRLTIVHSRVSEGEINGGLGSIEWISFKVELNVPCDLLTPEKSRDLQTDKSRCSDELKEKHK